MSKALIMAAPYAVDLIRESLQICSSIMEYRLATLNIEVQRESKHRQADLALQQEKHQHELKIHKMQQISANFGLVLESNRMASQDIMQMYRSASDRATQLLAYLTQPELPNELRVSLLEAMTLINNELSQLAKHHYAVAGQSLTAYVHSCDQLRDGPNTFTDVS